MRRELMLAVRTDLFNHVRGSTDSELMFHLGMLTFGLPEDPVGAVERMAGFVEACKREQGIKEPLQMTVGLKEQPVVPHPVPTGPVVR